VSISTTSARSSSARFAGVALILATVGVLLLYTFVAFTADAQTRAEMLSEAQSAANAAALGSVAEVPRGTIAVIRAASHIIGTRQAQRSLPSAEQHVMLGHWDAAGQSFATGPGKPNAVQITIRLKNDRQRSAFLGITEDPIEAQAIAVIGLVGKSLVADASDASASATR
jgi:hypothetical protein